jgi:acyl-coenzyme A thioesterase PaaI-like protein
VTQPEAIVAPSGEAAHFRALEQLYRSAPINRMFRSDLFIPSPGLSVIDFDVDESAFHAAGAVHGTVYFKMLDDAAFYAANSLVSDRFLLTTAFNLLFTRPIGPGRIGRGRGWARHGHLHAVPIPPFIASGLWWRRYGARALKWLMNG